MDDKKRKFFKRHPDNQFKRKGSNKRGRWNDSSHERYLGNAESADTVYRVLCPSRKIGGVIGKGGGIIRALREETRAKITVADSVAGSDERVIIIYSSPENISRKQNSDEDSALENEQLRMEPHCAAQDAILKVHDRIVEEDLFGGMASDDDNEDSVVTARLLVPNNMVGCLLGKGGDVIQRLRSETGASIRVLPSDHLPPCAMSTDELVQISGKQMLVKRALYEVSTLLHQNPRKDKPPIGLPIPHGGQNFHTSGAPIPNMPPPRNSMYPHRNSPPHGVPPMPWMGGYGTQPSGFGPGVHPGHGEEASAEFSMKILCPAGKIGGVIGKGGFNVKQIQQETGASIHVEDALIESDERIIRVSAFEATWNPRSQTIEAILQLQNKTSEMSEKGTVTTRLLVPSSKVGCILGQGGQVINEMRRRTRADIRVYSKDDRPKSASQDEELVQISGNIGVSKDALAEIASRLRMRTLRDSKPGAEPAQGGAVRGYGAPGRLHSGGPSPPRPMRAGITDGYDHPRGDRQEYGRQSYPVPPAATGYSNINHTVDSKATYNLIGSAVGGGRSNISNIGEDSEARLKLQEILSGGSDGRVEIHGSSDHFTAQQGVVQSYTASAGQSINFHQTSYPNMSPYQNPRSQQSHGDKVNAQESPYQTMNARQSPYQNTNMQQGSYVVNAQQSTYPGVNVPEIAYNNLSAQHGAYQY
ncbi:hypothetical protein HS088_TW05G00754 [Tripterygium wilfordii]|uniref:K Homology domain-containing protein n=1 Tax=Tripterygium wilfordii TaxID=458696 RepID=A0A7J7DNS0_TRIWF|nr:KH domain-containing protein HEN4-like [Tripterygium wilfordii]XP_038702176.1 KH domain-containing protein HEN4-like [Tripterygium wilfordii]KAF5748022.1 hypothetical protein HS088_TW05G00754 [Tripterygium wilfordii]